MNIRAAHRIAVARGARERRKVAIGDDVLAQSASAGVEQGDRVARSRLRSQHLSMLCNEPICSLKVENRFFSARCVRCRHMLKRRPILWPPHIIESKNLYFFLNPVVTFAPSVSSICFAPSAYGPSGCNSRYLLKSSMVPGGATIFPCLSTVAFCRELIARW